MKKYIISLSLLIICIFGVIKINAKKNKSFIIYIDPGHGGRDGGAVYDGVLEKDINLKISKYLQVYLENAGFIVYLTRETDIDLSSSTTNYKKEDIRKRAKMINDSDADLYISLHANAIGSTIWSGAQTFYNPKNEGSKLLAEYIQTSLKQNTKTDRNAKSLTDKFILDNVIKTGVLVEVGFLSNQRERELLTSSSYQDLIAHTIYIGILEYLSDKN